MIQFGLRLCTAVSMLVACSTPQSFIGAPHALSVAPPLVEPISRKPQGSPDVQPAPLLFISNRGDGSGNSGSVLIFSLPDLVEVKQIPLFTEADGMCSDRSGNVWVTLPTIGYVEKLSHTGQLIGLLSAPYTPTGCAVNPRNGDLATSDLWGVTVWTNASGNPQVYSDGFQDQFGFITYDPSGNLFVDGWHPGNHAFDLSELPAGGSTIYELNLNLGSYWISPGGVNWDESAGDLAVGDHLSDRIYHFSISGSSATMTGFTQLRLGEKRPCYMFQGTLASSDDYYAGACTASSEITRWHYPGGKITRWIRCKRSCGLNYAIGSAISQ
jgi:hypothetical protein